MIPKRFYDWTCTLADTSILSSLLFRHTCLIQKFIHKFCEFITNIFPGDICQYISECCPVTRSISPFGIRNALYPKHLKNPHIKLRNVFNMQLMFFSLHIEVSYFCKTSTKLFFIDVQLVARIKRALRVFAERCLQALVQYPYNEPDVQLRLFLRYHMELCTPLKSTSPVQAHE